MRGRSCATIPTSPTRSRRRSRRSSASVLASTCRPRLRAPTPTHRSIWCRMRSRSTSSDPSDAGSAMALSASDESPENVARQIALRLLDSQPRTRAELAQAMARRGVPSDAATAVLDRFTEVGLIDDEAFAAAWGTSRHNGRGLGRRAVAAELRRRGVQDETVAQAVAEISADDERIAATALVERRLRAMTGLPRETQLRRLVGMLARKGFSHGLARSVVLDALGEQASSADLPL